MKTPKRIKPLVDDGLVDEVLRQLMSGKEATVYVVRCGEEIRCAKVYKEANLRSFHQNASYQEGRRVKNSRQARAMEKGTRYGRKMQEEVWQNAEVDALYRLAAAGVRVPKPYICFEGVLLMDLITDAGGNAAPRLNDVVLTEALALKFHDMLLRQVVRMLCAGIIHGDLSEYNILVDAEGPVIIDLPQAVDAAGNTSAGPMLERDVANLATYFGRFAPSLLVTQYGKEIWALYQAGLLHPDVALTGRIKVDKRPVDVGAVLREMELARREEEDRRRAQHEMEG
jgi:RIO kinase 1